MLFNVCIICITDHVRLFIYLVLDPISLSSLIKKFCFVPLNFLIFWVWDRQAIEGNEISQSQWNSLQFSLKVLHFSSGARKWPGLLYPYKKKVWRTWLLTFLFVLLITWHLHYKVWIIISLKPVTGMFSNVTVGE